MAIIVSADITLADRRSSVRELADVSAAVFPDADLDRRLENYDAVARTHFGLEPDAVPVAAAAYFRPLVVVANYLAAIAIRQGIAGEDNVRVITDMIRVYKDVVASYHKRTPEQIAPAVYTSAGIGDERGAFA